MPAPALVTTAAAALRLPCSRITVVGSSDAVVAAAIDAGAHAIRLPGTTPGAAHHGLPCAPVSCPAAAGPQEAAELLIGV